MNYSRWELGPFTQTRRTGSKNQDSFCAKHRCRLLIRGSINEVFFDNNINEVDNTELVCVVIFCFSFFLRLQSRT